MFVVPYDKDGLDDADVQLSLARSIHIHGQVGHQEGPQVSDPRAPEFAEHLELFLQMWISICQARQQAGYTTMTFTPEFGPAPYMPEVPFTRAPLVDLWEINLWMFDVFKRRFNATFWAKLLKRVFEIDHRPVRLSWAKLLKRVFEIDMEHCPNCGGELRIIAAILEQPVIEKILTHLGLQARAPPRAPARGSQLQAA